MLKCISITNNSMLAFSKHADLLKSSLAVLNQNQLIHLIKNETTVSHVQVQD